MIGQMELSKEKEMSKIYILQEMSKYDLYNLKDFGEVVYLFKEKDKVSPMDPAVIQEEVDRIPWNSDDYIALVGKMACVSIFMALIVMLEPKLKYLVFDSKKSLYVSRVLDTSEEAEQ